VQKLRRLAAGFSPRRLGVETWKGDVGFVMDKVALEQVFSEYFGFPYQSFHRLLHNRHHHPGRYNRTFGPLGINGLHSPPPHTHTKNATKILEGSVDTAA
jgi:hypothetical protein